MNVGQQVVQSVPSDEVDFSYLIVEATRVGVEAGPRAPREPKGKEPEPPPDITMTFIARLPGGFERRRYPLTTRPGPLTYADLAGELASIPDEDGIRILVLEPPDA